MPVNDKHVLFVYGTLKRACHNYPYLQRFTHRFLSEANLGKEYSLFVSFLPFLVQTPGDGAEGELFLVDKTTLDALDRLEGHPHNYKRTQVNVRTKEGKQVQAWAYIFQRELPPGCRRVTNFKRDDLR